MQCPVSGYTSGFFSSTLRKYVEALGGEFEVVANLGNKRVKVLGV